MKFSSWQFNFQICSFSDLQMDFAVCILVVFSVVILSAQGKPYYVVNGPEREQDNNYIAHANEKTVRTRVIICTKI